MNAASVAAPRWASPIWPDRLPEPAAMDVAYGAYAYELVVRFSPERRSAMVVVVPLTTPEFDYASVMVDAESGTIVGVHVYPLLAFAIQLHPDWEALAGEPPQLAAIAGIIGDIKNFFDLYGVDDTVED